MELFLTNLICLDGKAYLLFMTQLFLANINGRHANHLIGLLQILQLVDIKR